MESSPSAINSTALEAYFKVLAYANRIDLLSVLRQPHTIEEIRLQPGPSKAGERPDRPISRQAVGYHVRQLERAGLVHVRAAKRDAKKPRRTFVVDQAQLYSLVEEFRKVSTLGAIVDPGPSETIASVPSKREAWPLGPKLLLVHGVYEGRAYTLQTKQLRDGRGWIIGRKAGAHVHLSYDPYVSLENSEVLKTGSEYRLLDLRGSRNGTFLNWERLKPGEEKRVRSGDLVGVGRSLLLFRED